VICLLRAVIFDMDGVIVDTMDLHFEAEQEVLRAHGVHIEMTELLKTSGMSSFEGIKKVSNKQDSEVSAMVAKKYAQLISKTRGIKPIPGFLEFFYLLKKHNVPLGLFSSSDRRFVEHILSELGINGSFKVIVCGNEVSQAKPSPEGYLKAAKLLNVSPSECVVVEDSVHGIMSAKSAGMKIVGVTNTKDRNFLLDADLIVDSLSELSIKNIGALFSA